MTEKTQFTPEDVGRSFYTATEGVTATLLKLDPIYGYKFNYSNGNLIFLDNNGKRNDLDRKHQVFPSRPVEDQTKLHPAIQHVNADGKLSNETIGLLNKLAEAAYKSSVPSQPTIDTEVEELARELFILRVQDKNGNINHVIKDSFNYAEQFIKFRNERRASHGK